MITKTLSLIAALLVLAGCSRESSPPATPPATLLDIFVTPAAFWKFTGRSVEKLFRIECPEILPRVFPEKYGAQAQVKKEAEALAVDPPVPKTKP